HYDMLDKRVKVPFPGQKKKFKEGTAYVGKGTDLSPKTEIKGTVVLGENCRIAERVALTNCVLGSGVKIQAGSELSGSVLWDDVEAGPATILREAVIGARTQLAEQSQVQEGAIIGDDCIVGHAAAVHPNVKVWPHKRIEDGAVLSTSLIWGDVWSRRL